MYVPLDKQAIIAQFELSASEIEAILTLNEDRKQNNTIIQILQEKRLVMPRNPKVLTDAGKRIKERLKAK